MFRVAVAVVLALVCCAAFAKGERTYFTDERIAVGRENVTKYPWAQELRARIFETGDPVEYYTGNGKYTAADVYAAQSDEFMWLLQPPTVIPRVYNYHETGGRTRCPVCGDKVTRISVWNAWRIDPVTHPYQVQCQMCRRWFPSNRYHEGDMTSGDYPDDGEGWVHDGKRYCFLREYAHMCYGSVVIPTLRSLSEAYALTGDAKYARKGSILLARLATEYPNYGWDHVTPRPDLENRFERTYLGRYDNHHPYYTWKQGGMITDLIWESFALEPTAYAYDAFYDYLGSDPDLIAFLKEKGMPIANADDLRRYIEDYVFRAAMVGLLDGWIRGNEGFHQAAALAVALVMDDYSDTHPNSKDLVDFAYHGAGRSAYMLVNGLDRDGGGHESPNYNRIKRDFIRVAQLMEEVRRRRPEEYPVERYPDIFAGPKARGLFDFFMDITILDTFLPSIGDCGGISRPSRYPDSNRKYSVLTSENLYAFYRYGDPRFARAATTVAGEPFAGSLWEPYPAEALQEALAQPESAIKRESRLLDGYGVAVLESGEWPQSRAAMLNYTSTVGHRQNDHLMLELFARGVKLLPDLGYPRTWDYRYEWDSNSLAHNTVTVNETRPVTRSFRNGARLFASAEGVHVAVAHHNPYPEGMGLGGKNDPPVDLYERTVLMIDVDDERFYVVDLFAVNGGEQHDQSWHAMLVPCEAPDLDWQVQETGTLAGPDVAPFAPYTDRWGRTWKTGNFPCFVSDVRRAVLPHPAAWTWPSGLPEGDTLRMHVVPVGGAAEVIMGRGRSPVWPENEALDYLFVRRLVENGARSRFVTVLDGYQGKPTVDRVRVLNETPLTLEVTRPDGVDEVTLHLPDDPSRTTRHRPVGVRVVSRAGEGNCTRDVRVGDPGDRPGKGYARGVIRSVDHENQRMTVEMQPGAEKDFAVGRTIRVYNRMRSAMLRIVDAEPGQGRVTLTLDKSALMAQLPITQAREGKLELGVKTPFITGHVVSAAQNLPAEIRGTAVLTDGPNDYYYGCWLGEGKAARLVQGIANASPAWLHLVEPVEDDALTEDYAGKVVPLWLYGVGDSVEVARIETESKVSATGLSLRSPFGLLVSSMAGAVPDMDKDGMSHVSLRNRPSSSSRRVPDEAISSLEQERDCRVARGLAPRNDGRENGTEGIDPAPGRDGAPELHIARDGDTTCVEVRANGDALMMSPPEGLWSIAMDWRDDWPCDWVHGHPTKFEQQGPWTILHGAVKTKVGEWHVRDAYRGFGKAIKCVRRFEWHGEAAAERCTLSVRFHTPGTGAGVLMPGILYHGNPSGAKSGRVPVYMGSPGEEALYEEHRFAMPYASFEWESEGARCGAALHTCPSPVPAGNLDDQWWSLGVVARDGLTELTTLSGPCASNGERSVVKAVQPGFKPYGDAYLNVPPGAVIEKTFYLEAYSVETEGSGFQRPTQTSLDIFAPTVTPDLPSFREILEAKYRFAQTRWLEQGNVAGFRKYPNKDILVMGWCGQAAANGYAFQVLADQVGGKEALAKAQKSLDFLSTAEFYDGGFHTWYFADKGKWDRHEPLSQGQAMLNFANAINAAGKSGLDSTRWREFLRKACAFHAERILADDWNPLSTSEAFFIAPLCEGYRLFKEEAMRQAAEQAGEAYAERSVNMREPYWGGTLDASCEDKEGAYAALQGFLALYELTDDPAYLEWAQHACDVVLTYVVVWDIDLPPGRLRDHGFKTRGWTVVSPQNQHIDVFGVLIAPYVYRMGQITERDDLRELALLMYRSCGQLLDPYGSQGEQPQHTTYAQRGEVDDITVLRGGYHEDWTVFWITAHFLNAGAMFREMGVNVWE